MPDKRNDSRLGGRAVIQERAAWLMELSKACGAPMGQESFIEVHETMRIKQAFFTLVKDNPDAAHLFWPMTSQNCVLSYLRILGERCPDKNVILFSKNDKHFGAIQVRLAAILWQPFAVWTVTEEDFAFTEKELGSGLCLERNFYGAQGEYVAGGVFELTAWGDFAIAQMK